MKPPMKPPPPPKLTHEELLASMATKHVDSHAAAHGDPHAANSAWYTPHRLLNAAPHAPTATPAGQAQPNTHDPLEPNARWLQDDELADELALLQEAAHSPLAGPGKWLAGALLAAVGFGALLLAWVGHA